jgi:type IV pilus assembly protein PilC
LNASLSLRLLRGCHLGKSRLRSSIRRRQLALEVLRQRGKPTSDLLLGRLLRCGDRCLQVLALLDTGLGFGLLGGGFYFFLESWKRSEKMQVAMDRLLLRLPIFGDLINKSVIARWTRTLSTMFAAGVPLVEALDSVGGASGNAVYAIATEQIQRDVSTGSALTTSMTTTGVFPNMVLQMTAIGEESGSLDHMLAKAAEFYEEEVDEMVKGLSSLMEPFIIVILGVLIGGIVVSMYLPIFKLGAVV